MSFSATAYPYRTVVYITDTIGGQDFQGSGVLISPDEVLTASHVLYTTGIGTATNIEVSPAYSAGSAPFGTVAATTFHYFPIDDANDLISVQQSQFDYAVIHLAQSFPTLGFMGLESNFPGGAVNITGYPGSADGLMENSQQSVVADPTYTVLDGAALGKGSSGGPVWITGSNGPYVVGVVSSGSTAGAGTFAQITTAAFNQIESWVAQDDGITTGGGGGTAPETYAISPNPASVNENAGTLTFTVTRSSISLTETVLISTVADQGSSNNANYQPLINQALNFAVGQSSAQVSLTINDLGLTSGSETFRIVVQQTTPVTANVASATFTIANNDTPTLVTVSGPSGTHAAAPFLISARAAVAQQAANIVNNAVAEGQVVPVTFTPGTAIPAAPIGKAGSIIMHIGGAVTLPGGYTAFATDATAPVSVTGGSAAGELIIAGTGGLNFTAGAGSGTVMAGGGNNTINMPTVSGNQYVYLGGGADTVQTGTGQATIDAGPGNNLLNLGTGTNYVVSSGNDTIHATGGAVTVNAVAGASALVFSGSSALSFSSSGNASTVISGTSGAAGADTIFANGGGDYYGGNGSFVFIGGRAGSTAVGGSGNNTLFGGTSDNDLLVAGTGPSTLVGSNGISIVGLGAVPDVLIAGAGSETLVGSGGGGNDILFANTGTDALFAGTGNDTFVASSGTVQMVGGPGQDLFVFVNGATGGSASIWNFTQGQDHVALFGYGANIAPSLIASAVVSGNATTITLPDHTTITFGNVANLTTSDLFAA
jgi:V8-like Glu-specific endopeptidase